MPTLPVHPFKRKFGTSKRDENVERTRERLLARRSIPLPYQETDDSRLWDEHQKGKPASIRNIAQDIKETAYDVRDEPEEVPYRVSERAKDYLDQGPDINQPVPLTPNPYRNRKRRTGVE